MNTSTFHPRTLALRDRCHPPTPWGPDPFPVDADRDIALGMLRRCDAWSYAGTHALAETFHGERVDIAERLIAADLVEPHDAARVPVIEAKKYPHPPKYLSDANYVLTTMGAVYLVHHASPSAPPPARLGAFIIMNADVRKPSRWSWRPVGAKRSKVTGLHSHEAAVASLQAAGYTLVARPRSS